MKYLFLDTNIYLHYQDFQQIPWNKLLGIEAQYTIVVVPKVHAELDEKKDSAKGKIQKRAKKISSKLYEILINHEKTKIPMLRCKAPNPTEEDRRLFDLSRSDNMIILTALKSGWKKDDIIIVSADKNIQFTAEDFGLGHYLMEDEYLLPPEQDEKDIEIQRLKHELEQLKTRYSSPAVLFDSGDNEKILNRPLLRNIDEELKCAMDEVVFNFPEATTDNYSKVIADPSYLFTHEIDAAKIEAYNKEREEYIKEEYEYKRLMITKEITDASFQKLSFKVINNGTAPTGDMMIFLRFPDNVKLYSYNKSRVSTACLIPLKPEIAWIAMPRETRRAMIRPFADVKENIWLWNKDRSIKNREFQEAGYGLLQGLQMELDITAYVNVSDTNSFTIQWAIVDATLSETKRGSLDVIIK